MCEQEKLAGKGMGISVQAGCEFVFFFPPVIETLGGEGPCERFRITAQCTILNANLHLHAKSQKCTFFQI